MQSIVTLKLMTSHRGTSVSMLFNTVEQMTASLANITHSTVRTCNLMHYTAFENLLDTSFQRWHDILCFLQNRNDFFYIVGLKYPESEKFHNVLVINIYKVLLIMRLLVPIPECNVIIEKLEAASHMESNGPVGGVAY